MAQPLLVGVDLGSGGAKVSIVSAGGQLIAESNRPYSNLHQRPGWVEQQPDDWFAAAMEALGSALRALDDGERRAVAGISFSAPHHIAVLLDAADRPIRPSIMWSDQRSGGEAAELLERFGDRIHAITGNAPSPTWTLPQLLWLRSHEPAALEQTARIVFMKDYVRYRFCGEFATDRIDAQGALFYDILQGRWADELLAAVGVDAAVLPPVLQPEDRAGTLLPKIADELGLSQKVPVIVGTADTVTELLAAGAVRTGDTVVKLATAGNVAMISERLPTDSRVLVYEHLIAGRYYWNSATSSAAASLRWLSERMLGMGGQPAAERYAAIDDAALSVPLGAEGLLFTPFLNGERSPHWDARLRASFVGLTAGHGQGHLARAVMEGVTFSLLDAATVHTESLPERVRLIGGGARSRVWPQIVADVLDREVAVTAHGDSSYGTALVAGVGIGEIPGFEQAAELATREVLPLLPNPERTQRYQELAELYREVVASTQTISHGLARFVAEHSGSE